jgi:plastocyanin
MAAVALLVTLYAGCGSGSSTTSSSSSTASTTSGSTAAGGSQSSAAASGTTITIQNFKFDPTPLTVKAGDTITVTNQDGTDHELKADDGSFDAGRFATGSKTFTASKAGTFSYHCDVHTYMTGVLQVTG